MGRAEALLFALGVTSLVLAASRDALADELRVSEARDLAITLTGASAALVADDLRDDIAPDHCRWCDRDAQGRDTVNAVDRTVRRRLRWKQPWLAATLSNVDAFMAIPLASGGLLTAAAYNDGRGGVDTGKNLLAVAEAAALAADLNQAVKLVVARERPDAHARMLADPTSRRSSGDDDLSFYSGHTTEAVTIAVAAGTVASIRGYRLAPLVWGVSLPLALATGYLRIGADRHYFTDVLVGALTGAAVGLLVPYAMRASDTVVPTQSSSGQLTTLGLSGTW